MTKAILQRGTIEGVVAIYETSYAVSGTISSHNALAMAIRAIIDRNWSKEEVTQERMENVRKDICDMCKCFISPLYSTVDKIHFLDTMMIAADIPRSFESAEGLIDKIRLLALDDFYGSFTNFEMREADAQSTRLMDIFQLIYAPV